MMNNKVNSVKFELGIICSIEIGLMDVNLWKEIQISSGW